MGYDLLGYMGYDLLYKKIFQNVNVDHVCKLKAASS